MYVCMYIYIYIYIYIEVRFFGGSRSNLWRSRCVRQAVLAKPSALPKHLRMIALLSTYKHSALKLYKRVLQRMKSLYQTAGVPKVTCKVSVTRSWPMKCYMPHSTANLKHSKLEHWTGTASRSLNTVGAFRGRDKPWFWGTLTLKVWACNFESWRHRLLLALAAQSVCDLWQRSSHCLTLLHA